MSRFKNLRSVLKNALVELCKGLLQHADRILRRATKPATHNEINLTL